jgi:hypothetical protein
MVLSPSLHVRTGIGPAGHARSFPGLRGEEKCRIPIVLIASGYCSFLTAPRPLWVDAVEKQS